MKNDIGRELRLFAEHLDVKDFRALSTGIGLGVVLKEPNQSPLGIIPIGDRFLPPLPAVSASGALRIKPGLSRPTQPVRASYLSYRGTKSESYYHRALMALRRFIAVFIDTIVISICISATFLCVLTYASVPFNLDALSDLGSRFLPSAPFYAVWAFAALAFVALVGLYQLLFRVVVGFTIGDLLSNNRMKKRHR